MNEIRTMRSGEWYWVSKVIIQLHASRMKFLALAVYNLLASMANEEQRCYPSQAYIAGCLGCSRSSVSRAIKRLKEEDLIGLTEGETNRSVYVLLEAGSSTGAKGLSHQCNSPVASADTNNTRLTRLKNNVVGDSKMQPTTDCPPETRTELLAADIAEALEDQRHFQKYLSYAKEYPESVLREFLSEVKQTPSQRIKKSRAAFFAYLVKQYARQTA